MCLQMDMHRLHKQNIAYERVPLSLCEVANTLFHI